MRDFGRPGGIIPSEQRAHRVGGGRQRGEARVPVEPGAGAAAHPIILELCRAFVRHRARRFGRQLHGRYRLAVHEVDERYTTVAAEADGAQDADAAAAALILEQFFREQST